MINGIILQIGTPDEIYSKPKSVFVANFLANPVNNIFKTKKKISDNPPLTISYYDDGTLYIPTSTQNEIVKSIKSTKLKEVELLDSQLLL